MKKFIIIIVVLICMGWMQNRGQSLVTLWY